MPPKRGGKPNNKKKNNNQSDSDDDWVPTDVFGNPMPIVDTSGWDELKTYDPAKRQSGVKSKGDSKRDNRQTAKNKNDQKKEQNQNDSNQQQQHQRTGRARGVSKGDRHDEQQNNNQYDPVVRPRGVSKSDFDSDHEIGHLYHKSDGATTISSRQRSSSRGGRNNQPPQKDLQAAAMHRLDHKTLQKAPQVYKPTTITLTSFESKDRSFDDSAAGSKPVTVRTIFAKMSPEEKEEQRKVTLLPLPTYASTNGEFLPENITTLTPGYVAGTGQPKRAKHGAKHHELIQNDEAHNMPISPLYHQFHIQFPHRPKIPNPRALTPQQYRDIEESTFHQWLSAIYTKYKPTELNHFEHNLYVWKQLWLCCESSDIILIILDARNPLFHFNSHLYQYIVNDLKKPFVLVLNKIDLIPIHVSLGFKAYLERTFPGVHVVLFSSYPSTLHSFVLALQHQAHGTETETGDPTNPALTIDALLKHNVDVTANDIATHQRTVVSRMKMANIIDTVGVDELLQLCLHLTRGHVYHSPADVYASTMQGAKGVSGGDDNDNNTTASTKDANIEDKITNADIHSRRILSQHEHSKWKAKNKKQQSRQDVLQEHLRNFISHAEQVEKEIKQEEQDEQNGLLSPLDEEMEELSLGASKSQITQIGANKSSRFKPSYFRDTDIIDNPSDFAASEGDNDDSSSDDDEYNGGRPRRYSQTPPQTHVLSSYNANSKIDRLEPPQIGSKFVRPLREKKPYAIGSDEDEDDEDEDGSDGITADDEDDEPDYDNIELYMPELSMTEDEIEAIELSHIVQNSPTLSASRHGSPIVSSTTLSGTSSPSTRSRRGKTKPVFDLQRVLQHIYENEENTREAHTKTKESLRQFEQIQREVFSNVGNDDDLHKPKMADAKIVTRAQQKEEEKKRNQFIRANKIKIGLVGHPNVGKSSVVNAISRKKTVSVSRQPGHTKYNQTIIINELVTLIDCPGLIFPTIDNNKISSTLFGLYPIPQLSLPIVVIYYLAQMIDLVNVLDLNNYHPLRYQNPDNGDSPIYPQDNNNNNNNTTNTNNNDVKTMDDLLHIKVPHLPQQQQPQTTTSSSTTTTLSLATDVNNAPVIESPFSPSTAEIGYGWTANTICEAFAIKRGFMTSKGIPDPQRAAQQILYLIADGKIQLYMLPPNDNEEGEKK